MNYKKEQEKLRRWYEKRPYWTYKQNCSVCGAEFYTCRKNETVCYLCNNKIKRKSDRQSGAQKNEDL